MVASSTNDAPFISKLGMHEEPGSSVQYVSNEMGVICKVRLVVNSCYLVFVALSFAIDMLFFDLIVIVVRLLPIPGSLKKTIYGAIKVAGHHTMVSLFEFWFPHTIFVAYNKEVLGHDKNIVISNHCTDYDWLFISQVMQHLNKLSSIYIIMKDSLRKIPVLGYIMETFGYVFLTRRKSNADKKALERLTSAVCGTSAYDILIFPEGTYPTPKSIEDAKEYAKTANLRYEDRAYIPELVLIPRKGGFELMRQGLEDFEGVVDITILMNPYVRIFPNEFSLSKFILYGSQRINQAFIISYVPKNELTDDNFLGEAFYRKDRMLQEYVNQVLRKDHGKTSADPIRDIAHFEEILKNINPAMANYRIEEIRMHSPYRAFALMMAPLLAFAFAYAASGLLRVMHNALVEYSFATSSN